MIANFYPSGTIEMYRIVIGDFTAIELQLHAELLLIFLSICWMSGF